MKLKLGRRRLGQSLPDLSGLNIVNALHDPRLIGDSLSVAQEAALRALYGQPLDDAQLAIFERATGREIYLPREYREGTFICGRRAGKSSKLAANIAVYEACFHTHRLARGERAYVIALAPTKRQAAIVFGYVLARLEGSPVLRQLIEGKPRINEVHLANDTTIGVWACDFHSIRGISVACAICDEVAFWHDDVSGANPALEVLRAIRPAMASFQTAKLIKISSPFAKSGIVWDDWSQRQAHPELLVWRLDSLTMNPTLDAAFLADEEKRDPESYAKEYGAEFYEAANAFLPAEAVESCVVAGCWERPPQADVHYTGALDAAFRSDCFAFSIVHRVGEKIVQDFVRSWRGSKSKPVNLSNTLGEIVATLRSYNAHKIHGDQFCSEPLRQMLKAQGIEFVQSATLGTRASGIWNSLRTLVTSRQIELLDDAETLTELKRLELIVTGAGNQRVEAHSGHDDRAVALALAVHECVSSPRLHGPICTFISFHEPGVDAGEARFFRHQR